VGKSALHRVDRNPLEIVQRPAECVGTLGELACHRRVAHQAIIGVERYAESQSAEHADGMFRDRFAHSGVDV